jgi:hypothetical protein
MFQKTFPQIIDFIKSLYPDENPAPLHAPRFTGNEKKYVIDANEVLYQTAKFDISLDELISRVCAKFEIRVKDLVSKSRKRYLSQARGVVCYLAVDELGYSGDDVARSLRISGRGVSDCRERGKKIVDKPEIIGEYLQ